jgi:transcriptional regulator with XRE-family HTH domain
MLACACANERIMLGLTQQQLADLIGVTYQQAHKYERGINRVAAGRLYKGRPGARPRH